MKKETEYYNQSTAEPTQKVAAAGIGGSLTVVLVYVLGQFGVELPSEVVAALTTIVAFLSGYLVKDKRMVRE